MDPFVQFQDWYNHQIETTAASLPAACCLSTIGLDGCPNARFVSLKALEKDKFIITGPLESRKGLEIKKISKAALTFWWDETQRQVRIQGDVEFLEKEIADRYFKERNKASQLVSFYSHQGEEIENRIEWENGYYAEEEKHKMKNIERPVNWGGFVIHPTRIEFMEFKKTRLHQRDVFILEKENWKTQHLQP